MLNVLADSYDLETAMDWKRSLLTILGAATIFILSTTQAQSPPTPSAQAQKSPSATSDDEERIAALLIFIHNADQRDIEMANLAKRSADSGQVKDFAEKVIADSKASDNEVQSYARRHNIDLNKAPPT